MCIIYFGSLDNTFSLVVQIGTILGRTMNCCNNPPPQKNRRPTLPICSADLLCF